MPLELRSIQHRFKRQTVLHDVSLHVEQGDCYGLLGHNGAGKTTLLRIALGLLKPTTGTVAVDGFGIGAFPREARARMGGLVESPGSQEGWTGLKNLEVLARLQGFEGVDAKAQARRVLALVGLDRHPGLTPHKKVRDYSQGMKQRLGMAQALIGRPSYLILDEPMNGLDPQAVVEGRDLIRRLTREEGVTVVISSHQLAEISGLCNKVAILRQGVLLVEESMDRLLETDPGASGYRLTVRGRPSQVQEKLDRLSLCPELENAKTRSDHVTFRVDLKGKTPSDLTRDLLDQDVPLVALMPCESTLEEVYLRIDAAPDNRAPAYKPPKTPIEPTLTQPETRRAPRRPFWRCVQYEWTRLFGGYRLVLLMLLPAILAWLAIFAMHREAAANVERVADTVFSTTQITGFDGLGAGLKVGLLVLMVFMAGLASQSVSGEHTRGTLRYLFLRPVSRTQWAAGKFAALVAICLASYALLVAASLWASAAYFDFTDLAELLPNGKLFPLVEKQEMMGYLRAVLWAPILPLIAYTALGFGLGSWIRSNVGALGSCLGSIVLLDLARMFVSDQAKAGWLLSAHLPSPLGGQSFLRYYCDVVQGVSNAANPYAYGSVTVPIVWGVCLLGLAVIGIHRKAG